MVSLPLDRTIPLARTHLGGSASREKDKSDIHKGHQCRLLTGTEPCSLDTSDIYGKRSLSEERVVGEISFNTIRPPLQQHREL
ncbi:hypothetical protein NPIL_515701 [Nephila pilipes]|uniref:Uncharacterized protein n=1 Tax=Nephila pilipes TaxID=299642 RepID=A0A8X6N748_NEPPI|nr:hypothetical protein NPIL_515701 [Nephila pilipes]